MVTLLRSILLVTTLMCHQLAASCLTQSADFELIQSSMEQGSYRYVTNHDVAKRLPLNQLTFEQYLTASETHIKALNPKAALPCPINNYVMSQLAITKPNVVDLIKPFELVQPTKNKVVLLFHGLTDSPYSFHDLAEVYHRLGFTVRAIRLPGHSTVPEHLRFVTYQDWQAVTQFAIEHALNDFEQVYLAGFSTGGALIWDYLFKTEKLSSKLAGIMLFAPASQAQNANSWLAKYVDYIPFFNWLDKEADVDFAKYESFPINAAAQVHGIMSQVYPLSEKHALHNIPVFAVIPEADTTINSKATLNLLSTWQAKHSYPLTLVYYGESETVSSLFQKDATQLIFPQCQQSGCQQNPIMAHTAVINSPLNQHYGTHGAYRNCGHYLADNEKYQMCKTANDIVASETSPSAKANLPLFKRLTYNPYFSQLADELAVFLTK